MPEAHGPTTAAIVAMADDFVTIFEAAQPNLDALDAQGGDADHGTTMVLAARAAQAAVAGLSRDGTAGDAFALIGDGFASVGGSVGPLWAAAWYAIAETTTHEVEKSLVAPAFDAIVEAVASIGGAREGDGTMLDALAPAARAAHGSGPRSALIESAAQEGAMTTAGRPARIGRAARSAIVRLGPDPGAASAVLIVGHLASVLESGNTGIAK